MIEAKVSDTRTVVTTRQLVVEYEGPEVTLEMLRDFVNRTRNQRQIPNWDPQETVVIEPVTDDDTSILPQGWRFTCIDNQKHEAAVEKPAKDPELPLRVTA